MKKIFKIALFCTTFLTPFFGFDFELTGQTSAFSKVGFDGRKYNPQKNIYPTDSYATILGEMDFEFKNITKGLDIVIGGMLNALVYDSTIHQGQAEGYPYNFGTQYIGYWAGHSGLDVQSPRFFMIHNAYINYNYEGVFGLKIGRYETDGQDWFTAFNQGGEFYAKYKDFKIWGMFSDARASAYNDWFWDYGRFYTQGEPLMSGGIEFSKYGLSISPYYYYIPNSMNAPGFNITYDTNPNFNNIGLRSKTTIVMLFPFYSNISPETTDVIAFNEILGKNAQSLFIRQQFYYNNYNFGGILYKNFGNANGRIGVYGDPITYNIWTGSVYDFGPALSNMVGKDALSGFLYVGQKLDKFDWQILGRLTTSPRADEQSLALYLSYAFNEKIDAGFKLEYMQVNTHKGYQIGSAPPLESENFSDRSHLMMHITRKF
ncbi:outer membrane family protein [Helicobacter cappadocius]|uniref:Outer membrane family protein n=1 Tax=Helicobacter cappadocius TaxID=3063998 RepID=A0AA90TA70_9HELI|nr:MULTISPECIES: outer membrane family protein [unclassified Helicobacter]MDO7253680.1 outer membrane family protein [Helicobacter sp. faydin-H75]MDP2539632.1 outer membrane family protein [Helicobacter sp. faydin-H76]